MGLGWQSARSQSSSVTALAGVYENVAPDGGRSAIVAGTDEALADARRIVRALARPRILENNPPVNRLTIAINGSEARVTYDGQRSYYGPIGNGAPVTQTSPEGGEVNVRYILEGDALVEIAEAKEGTGRIRYELDGGELLVHTQIDSRYLPAPIRFSMRFRPEQP